MNRIQVVYYALLKAQSKKTEESVVTEAKTPRDLYKELKDLYSFTLVEAQIKVAINSTVSRWDAPLKEGDIVFFIPPVAGG